MTEFSTPSSGFMAFLPYEYQGKFSREWIMDLSPFDDQTCAKCFTVHNGKWVDLGSQRFDESALKCEARYGLV
ncbi:MAG: hypothetical protein AB7P24_14075 [Nitrospira sp.]